MRVKVPGELVGGVGGAHGGRGVAVVAVAAARAAEAVAVQEHGGQVQRVGGLRKGRV